MCSESQTGFPAAEDDERSPSLILDAMGMMDLPNGQPSVTTAALTVSEVRRSSDQHFSRHESVFSFSSFLQMFHVLCLSFFVLFFQKCSSSESLSEKASSELKKSFDAVVFDVLKVTPEEYAVSGDLHLHIWLYGRRWVDEAGEGVKELESVILHYVWLCQRVLYRINALF